MIKTTPIKLVLLISCSIITVIQGYSTKRTNILASKYDQHYIMRQIHGPLANERRALAGLFASYIFVVRFLNFIEQQKVPVSYEVSFPTGCYIEPSKGPNWWEYYFEPIEQERTPTANTTEVDDALDHAWAFVNFTPEKGHQIIEKYIKMKPEIQQKIDSFYEQNLKGNYIIGVHYRGTDKIYEVNRIAYEQFFMEIERTIRKINTKNYVIFVATDEQQFLDTLQQQFGQIVYQEAQRSSNGQPLHYGINRENPYQQGLEALIDFGLLAKSNIVIRGSSALTIALELTHPHINFVTIAPL